MSGNIRPGGLVSTIASMEGPIIRRVADPQRRVESPAEWAVEDAVARDPGVGREHRIPVPTRPEPTRAAGDVDASRIDIGFRQVFGTQGAEAVQVGLFEALLIKLRRLERRPVFHLELTTLLDLDLAVAVLHQRLAFEYPHLAVIRVESV